MGMDKTVAKVIGFGRCWQPFVIIVVGVMWGTVACSRPALPHWLGGPAPTPAPTSVQVTSELAFWHWAGTPTEMAYQQDQLAAFQTQFPAIEVTATYPADYARRLRTALGSDRPPDVIALTLYQIPDLVAAGLLAPLPTSVLTDTDRYSHLQTAMQVAGVPYCLPQSFQTLALFYNKALFDAAEVPYPDGSWQWEDLQQAAEALTVPESGQVGIALDADFSRWLAFLYQAGGAITNADTSAMAINSPEAAMALDFYTNLLLKGMAATPATLDSRWTGEAFATSRAAMTIDGNWLPPYLAQEAPELPYGMTVLPSGPAGAATISFATCLAVTRASPHQEAANLLLSYLDTADVLAGWIPLSNALPARPSLADQWRVTYPQQQTFIDQIAVAHEWQLPAGFQPWLDERNDELRRIFGGFIPVDALLPAAESEGNVVLAP